MLKLKYWLRQYINNYPNEFLSLVIIIKIHITIANQSYYYDKIKNYYKSKLVIVAKVTRTISYNFKVTIETYLKYFEVSFIWFKNNPYFSKRKESEKTSI